MKLSSVIKGKKLVNSTEFIDYLPLLGTLLNTVVKTIIVKIYGVEIMVAIYMRLLYLRHCSKLNKCINLFNPCNLIGV